MHFTDCRLRITSVPSFPSSEVSSNFFLWSLLPLFLHQSLLMLMLPPKSVLPPAAPLKLDILPVTLTLTMMLMCYAVHHHSPSHSSTKFTPWSCLQLRLLITTLPFMIRVSERRVSSYSFSSGGCRNSWCTALI